MADDEHMAVPRKRNSKLTASSNYRKNCTSGFPKPAKGAKKYWQAHHILSLTCMDKRKDDYPKGKETRRYLEDCLKCAKWDINDGHNMLGMPTNRYHKKTDGIFPMPSHQVDHNTANGYTKDVSTWLAKSLWRTLEKKGAVHKVDVTKIESVLRSCSSTFSQLLEVVHPARDLGTALSWKNRFDREDTWFQPFSMALTPSPRKVGSRKTLVGIFRKIAQ